MLFFAFAIHRYAMKEEISWIPIIIGTVIIAVGFGFSYWQYRQWQDDETEEAE